MSRFPSTQWSLIELAVRESVSGSREHMGRLLETYRQPMYAHLRYKGLKHEQAEDLLQEFMLEILNNDLLAIADPKRGKFRTLLLTALDRFVVTRHRYNTAAKRSPGAIASLDAFESDAAPAAETSPSLAFERAWALDVLAQALARMKEQCEREGQSARWSVFESRIVAPLLDGAPVPDYADLAAEHGLNTEKAAMNLLVTAKRQFGRILRRLVRDYVTRTDDTRQQVKTVSDHLVGSNINFKTANRVARHVVENSIGQAVEEEIEQLKSILAQSRSLADHIEDDRRGLDAEDELRNEFWRRLTHLDQQEPQLTRLYDWKNDQSADDEYPLDVHFDGVLDASLRELSDKSEDVPTGTVRACLENAEPSLEALEWLKEWATLQRSAGDQQLPHDVASALYFLAIAAALVRRDERISGLNDEGLLTGFRWTLEQLWLDDKYREIAAAAIDQLRQAPQPQ